jgi:hypothetical protein
MDDPNRRYTYIECVSNIQNTNGRPTQLTNADPRFVDYYGRPWAKNWEKYFEAGWDKPGEVEQEGTYEKLNLGDRSYSGMSRCICHACFIASLLRNVRSN